METRRRKKTERHKKNTESTVWRESMTEGEASEAETGVT